MMMMAMTATMMTPLQSKVLNLLYYFIVCYEYIVYLNCSLYWAYCVLNLLSTNFHYLPLTVLLP
jgi:hypothetical protein